MFGPRDGMLLTATAVYNVNVKKKEREDNI